MSTHRPVGVLSDQELQLVFASTPRVTWNLRSAVQQAPDGSYLPGFDEHPEPLFVDHTCRVLLATACHISRLPLMVPSMVSEGGKTGLRITWERAKPMQASNPTVEVPLPLEMSGWIRPYLALAKPKSNVSYFYMLEKVSEVVLKDSGHQIHLNPSRFRHTGIRRLKLRYHLTDHEAAAIAGCDVTTVQRYASESASAVAERIRGEGYDELLPGVPDPSRGTYR